MPSPYLGVVTTLGAAKLAASVGGTPIVITDIGIGDGAGAAITPLAAMTQLVHEVWRGNISAGAVDPDDAAIWRFTTIIAEESGPFDIREIALFDEDGVMIAIARHPLIEKRLPSSGVGVAVETDIIVPISGDAEVTVVVGDDYKVDLSRLLRAPFIAVESATLTAPPVGPVLGDTYLVAAAPTGAWAGHADHLAQWQGDIWTFTDAPPRTIVGVKAGDFLERTAVGWRPAALGLRYAAAGGAADALTATLDPVPSALTAGLPVFVKIAATNTGAATINVNGLGVKAIKRVTGDPLMAGDMPIGALALLVYDGAAFQLLSTIPGEAPPAASTATAGLVRLATSAEVIAGIDALKAVTAAVLATLTATSARRGLVELATLAEVLAGVASDLAVTPESLAGLTGTADRRGLLELATLVEAVAGVDTSRAVTPAGVKAAIDAVIDAAPGALDTLNELAAALGDDPNFAATVTAALAAKAPLASPALTGNPTAPTQAAGDSSTKLASTAFVQHAAQSGAQTGAVDTGSANNVVATLTPAPAALTAGLMVNVLVLADNSAGATLNLNGFGAIDIEYEGAALRPGVLQAGQVHQFVYDAVAVAWQLIGPNFALFDEVKIIKVGRYAGGTSHPYILFAEAFPTACLAVHLTAHSHSATSTTLAATSVHHASLDADSPPTVGGFFAYCSFEDSTPDQFMPSTATVFDWVAYGH